MSDRQATIQHARRRKALAICDVLWSLGADADRAETLTDVEWTEAAQITGRKGDVSAETRALVVETLRTWELTRPPESRGNKTDLLARHGLTPDVFDELAQRGLAAKPEPDDDDPFDLIPERRG